MASVAAKASGAKPNILLLMPDQWRWDWDGAAHRAAPLRTPTLDRLRESGTSFSHGAVVPAPQCAPSRAAMTSLREYDAAGVATNGANDFPQTTPSYFQALQRAGYHTMVAVCPQRLETNHSASNPPHQP